jgi:large subunit ribosomal protein L21
MFAVIKTGGKQYVVTPDKSIKIEKVEGEKGDKVLFDQVLLVSDENSHSFGTPTVEKAVVEGEIVRQARSKKVIVFKYHSKARYKKTKGHRQQFTEVKITGIKH